jgi:tRNA U34 2-thiouridine synthase MnmA/TrmU
MVYLTLGSSSPTLFAEGFSVWCTLCRYVVEKDVKNNVVFVSRNYFSLDKRRRSFRVGSLKWLSGSTPDMTSQLQCKV